MAAKGVAVQEPGRVCADPVFTALMIAAQGGELWIAATVHFVTLPYNVFLVLALWRTPGRNTVMTWTSLVWLGAVTML